MFGMNSLNVVINNRSYQIGQRLPESITNLEITIQGRFQIPKEQSVMIKAWLNELKRKIKCQYISYNNVLIKSSELKEF